MTGYVMCHARRRPLHACDGAAYAGQYDVAFGGAYLTQAPADTHVITCNVPEVVVIDDDEPPPDTHVDAACVCCELVARVGAGASEAHLQTVLGAVLQAFTGRSQRPEDVERLFHDRFKSARGQLMLEGPEQHQSQERPSERPEKLGTDTGTPNTGIGKTGDEGLPESSEQHLLPETAPAGVDKTQEKEPGEGKSLQQPGNRSTPDEPNTPGAGRGAPLRGTRAPWMKTSMQAPEIENAA